MVFLHPTRARIVRALSAMHHRISRVVAMLDAYRYLAINELTIPLYIICLALLCAELLRG